MQAFGLSILDDFCGAILLIVYLPHDQMKIRRILLYLKYELLRMGMVSIALALKSNLSRRMINDVVVTVNSIDELFFFS